MDPIKIIKKLILFHCARCAKFCEKCNELAKEGKKFCLIQVYLTPTNQTKPIFEIELDGKKILREFDVVKIFKNNNEARQYSINHSIEIFE
ncbi:MAG: hypothetical protein ACTSYC_03715 [Promethearchaeota archaeon]